MCSVWRMLQHPLYRTHSATLSLSGPQPTTTSGHYTTCCKSQSYAPEDGQKIAQNMLSWSWRSLNRYCCVYLDFLYYLPAYVLSMYLSSHRSQSLTLNLLTTTIVAPPSNASKWQMGFNSAFKGLMGQPPHTLSWSVEVCHKTLPLATLWVAVWNCSSM